MSDVHQEHEPPLVEVPVPEAGATAADAAGTGRTSTALAPVAPAGKRRVCAATTKSGKPCRANAGPAGVCTMHDPAMAPQLAVGRALGGSYGVRSIGIELGEVDLTSPADIRRVIAQVARPSPPGRIPSSVAGSVSQLLNTSIKLAEVELSARLQELERQLERLEEGRGRARR